MATPEVSPTQKNVYVGPISRIFETSYGAMKKAVFNLI